MEPFICLVHHFTVHSTCAFVIYCYHLVVKDKVAGKLGVSKSFECDIFPFSALTLGLGDRKGYPVCKILGVGLFVVTI